MIILLVIRKKKELGDTLPTTVAGSLKNNCMRKELSIDIPIVMENDLMCHESIIDVSLAMEPASLQQNVFLVTKKFVTKSPVFRH